MKADETYRLKKMASFVTGNKIADIGFAQMPNPYLQGESIVGIDPEATDSCTIYSQIFKGTLSDFIELNPGSIFNTVVAGEILEHIEDPIRFLKECFDVLENEGKLILSTPNPNSFIERVLTLTLNRKFFYTTDHIMLFPQRWLIRMLELSGFKEVKLYSGGFPIPYIGLIPFPRVWCYQTIAVAQKRI